MFYRQITIWGLTTACLLLVGCAPQLLTKAEPAHVAPTVLQAANAPAITHGPLSGEVSATSAVLWARGNQTGTIVFELATTAAFSEVVTTATVNVQVTSDFTGKATLDELAPDQKYFYRAALRVDDESSAEVIGQFATAPAPEIAAALNFVFGSCLGGQNYCRAKENGWPIFQTMHAVNPEFFLITGDSIYVDTACDGEKNVPGAEGPYRDLTGFRTRYQYHLEDEAYRNFLAQTPVYVTWDDHELLNDFGGPQLKALNPQLLAEGVQAYFEYWPLTGAPEEPNRIYRTVSYGAHADLFILDTRSYRDPNVNWDPHPRTLTPKTMLGATQFAWLQKELAASTATWKFVVSSTPLAYPTGFPQPEVDGRDGWANYTEHSGYETELMALTFYLAAQQIKNVVFLTGDAHWPYAISYDPDRNGAPDFYELSSSPLSAIPLAPPKLLDPTFNPTVLYAEGEFMGNLFNFGQISIAENGELTFRVMDWQGTEKYALTLPAE